MSKSLTEVHGDLVLAALCVGQFRAPCQIDAERLVVEADEALLQALRALGLTLKLTQEPFTPAPMFAPEGAVLDRMARAGALRRQVQTHVSRYHDEDGAEEDPSEASNA